MLARLKRFTNIKVLDFKWLQGVALKDDHLVDLSNALHFMDLRKLKLHISGSEKISDTGMQKLISVIESKKHLEELELLFENFEEVTDASLK